jgi:hypothetical protein
VGHLARHYRKIFVLLELTAGGGAHDARQGHGFGHIGEPTGAGTTHQARVEYPYTDGPEELDPDIEDEEPLDNDDVQVFSNKIGQRTTGDANRGRGNVDRQYFGLGEAAASISPIPDLYKGRQASGGAGGMAPTVYKTAPGKQGGGGKGSLKGWSKAPPVMFGDEMDPAYTLDDIPLNDDRVLLKIKNDHDDLTKQYYDDFTDSEDEIDDNEESC